jgi:hypothetical protein
MRMDLARVEVRGDGSEKRTFLSEVQIMETKLADDPTKSDAIVDSRTPKGRLVRSGIVV